MDVTDGLDLQSALLLLLSSGVSDAKEGVRVAYELCVTASEENTASEVFELVGTVSVLYEVVYGKMEDIVAELLTGKREGCRWLMRMAE